MHRHAARNAAIRVAVAVVGTGLTLGLVGAIAPEESYAFSLFFERSPIQWISTFCFWLVVGYLVVSFIGLRAEQAACDEATRILESADLQTTMIWADADMVAERLRNHADGRYAGFLIFRRILSALERLKKTRSTKEIDDYFRGRADIDANDLESRFSRVRYFIWLIPTLGFIGTVMGISLGISGFSSIVEKANSFAEVRGALPTVTSQLGTAFDTTLLALGLSVVAMYLLAVQMNREEAFLDRAHKLCIDGVCSLFEEHDAAMDRLVEAIEKARDEVLKGMHGDRAELARVLRDELPKLVAQCMHPVVTEAQPREMTIRSMPEIPLNPRLEQLMGGASADFVRAVERARDDLLRGVHADRAELARVLRDELPELIAARIAEHLRPSGGGPLGGIKT